MNGGEQESAAARKARQCAVVRKGRGSTINSDLSHFQGICYFCLIWSV